jgi:large subunit ribosomal protein L32
LGRSTAAIFYCKRVIDALTQISPQEIELVDFLGDRRVLSCYTRKAVPIYRNTMAVPKKKTSKSKRDKRRATWRNKAAIQARKALSLGKSVLTGRSTSFVYPQPDEEDAE